MAGIRNLAKRVPGARKVYRRLFRGPGSWIYTHENLRWMYRPDLRRQLPRGFRAFAHYARLQQPLGMERIVAGQSFVNIVIAGSKTLGWQSEAALDLGDYTVFLNLNDPRALQVPDELINEDRDPRRIDAYISAGDTFVDVGANHGAFTIYASQVVGADGLVVAIEPQPTLAALVEKSLDASDHSRFRVRCIACSDREGTAEFFVPSRSSGIAGLFRDHSAVGSHDTFDVRLARFDEAEDWRAYPGKVFVKLDVEGSELAFLRGARTMIRERRPHIMMEINALSMNAAGVPGEALVKEIAGLGYGRYLDLKTNETFPSIRDIDVGVHRNVILHPD